MSILTAREILEERLAGNIEISDFSFDRLNPNSYNLRLYNELLVYNNGILDMKEDNPYSFITIPDDGYLLKPGKLYLGRTIERTTTKNLVPMIEGRSSVGRLGISIHETAGFGDNGFDGTWTLEISCIQPVVIYPNVEIAQIYYHRIDKNKADMIYDGGKYQHQEGIMPSMLWKEFRDKKT